MTSFLVVTAMGADRPGIVNELTKLATDSHCNIVDSRMAVFGNECTLILLLSGQWNAIARFEADRRGLENAPGEVIDVDTAHDLTVAEAMLQRTVGGGVG